MKLKVKIIDLDAGGKEIVVLNNEDARELGVHALERVILYDHKTRDGKPVGITAVVNVSHKNVHRGTIVLYEDVAKNLGVKDGTLVNIFPRPALESEIFIRKKSDGQELDEKEIDSIVQDITNRNLNDLEVASFITALHINGMTLKENIFFTKSMIKTSKKMFHFSGNLADKHSAGGVPGDKTSILLVPIIAAAGLVIPKTSSRAITDPAGTADRVEVLTNVSLSPEKINLVVKKTGACLVWGGALNLAPVDDMTIQIEKPLSMDPLIVPSILTKKKIMGAKNIVLDIPVGPETKFKNEKEAKKMAEKFQKVGKAIGLNVKYVITDGHQPLGYTMGAALEAREALQSLIDPKNAPNDLVKKVILISNKLLKMAGKDPSLAKEILYSRKAEKKIREIIQAQGGNGEIMPEDILVEESTKRYEIVSNKNGKVGYIANKKLINVAKISGCPSDKYSGLLLNKKVGDRVEKGELLYTIYAEKDAKLKMAFDTARKDSGYVIR